MGEAGFSVVSPPSAHVSPCLPAQLTGEGGRAKSLPPLSPFPVMFGGEEDFFDDDVSQ